MNTPHKNAEILRALAEGKKVEFKFRTSCWITWNQSHHYQSPLDTVDKLGWEWRIKPEPKPDTVYFASISGPDFLTITKHPTDNLMLTFSGETGKLIKAEVI